MAASKKADEEKKKEIDPKQKATMFTIFTLFFPSLIITGIATASTSLGMAAVCIALFIYQAALLKKYVESNQL
jgi:ABC-type phosphate/phosphonate transport system permease subunit